jgi:hypothetical protein
VICYHAFAPSRCIFVHFLPLRCAYLCHLRGASLCIFCCFAVHLCAAFAGHLCALSPLRLRRPPVVALRWPSCRVNPASFGFASKMTPGHSSTPKRPSFKQRVLLITPRGDLSTAAMVDVAANKSDGASLGDSSSTPAPTASPSPAASADIGGSQTTVDAPEIGGDTELIPSVQKVPSKQRKAAKRRYVL